MSWDDVLSRLLEDLRDNNNPLTSDLVECGPYVLDDLRNAVQNVADSNLSISGCAMLDSMIASAYEKLSKGPPRRCWRRLYTDVCLFRSLADFSNSLTPSVAVCLESIARLDRAIIIAGPTGEERLELVLSIIKNIQSFYLSSQTWRRPLTPDHPASPCTQVETASRSIPVLVPSPSLSAFQCHYSRTPFILRSYARDWPAVQDRPWKSLDYLRSVAGPGRIVPVEVGRDYRADDWVPKLMPWDDFLSYLGSPQGETLYLAQYDLLKQFPALRSDIITPDYAYACLQPSSDFSSYQPPGNEEELIINTWLGPGGTITPAHTDPYFNIFVQVVGRKTVWLAAPHLSPFMYPHASSSSPSAGSHSNQLSNTSRVDIFPSNEASKVEQHKEHPEFWNRVVSNAMIATLEPGDVLFFPPGWWHAMRSEELSCSVSMWF